MAKIHIIGGVSDKDAPATVPAPVEPTVDRGEALRQHVAEVVSAAPRPPRRRAAS